MPFFAILFVLDTAVACWYAKSSYPKVDVKAFCLKMLASAIFVLSGSIAYAQSSQDGYSKLILSALVFGLIGDALLSFDPFIKEGDNKGKYMMLTTVLGAGFFLVGHALYIIAFIKEIKALHAFRLPVFLTVWLLGVGFGIGATLVLKLKHGKLGVPMLIYMLGLCAMGALSINLALFGYRGVWQLQVILMIAPLLFMTSDATLGLKFADNKRFGTAKMRYLTLLTYYPAQMLFSLTVLLRFLSSTNAL